MKSESYPQLFDTLGSSLKNEGEFNNLYHKYKIDEFKPFAKQKYEELLNEAKMFQKKYGKFRLIIFGCLPFMILFSSLIEGLSEIGFATAYSNAPFLFWALPALLVLAIICLIVYIKKHKKFVLMSAEFIENQAKELEKLIRQEFNFPQDIVSIDFFRKYYRAGKTKPLSNVTSCMIAYSDDWNVYIYYETALLKIPKRDCMLAEIVNSPIRFNDTTRSINYKAQENRQYEIKPINAYLFKAKYFGRLLFQTEGEFWTLDFLPYSFDAAKKLFGKE